MIIEKRLSKVEVRDNEPETDEENGQQQEKVISGYAILFNEPSQPMPVDNSTFTETISPQALQGVDFSKLVMIYNHDYANILASVKAGTLTVNVDEKGLAFKATLPDTTVANDVYENIKAGNLDSMSFGFSVLADEWQQADDGSYTRQIDKIENLYELSVVTLPAYDSTELTVDTRNLKINKEDNNMFQKVKSEETVTPVQAFNKYVRNAGNVDAETRAAITTTEIGAVLPKEVIEPAFELKNNPDALANFATVLNVSNNAGSLPVVTSDDTTVLATKAEAAEMADVDYTIKSVDYKVQTRAGRIVVSDEAREDAAVDIVGLCKGQLQKLVQNTDNQNILKLLGTLTAKNAKTIDDLKTVFNVDLNPALTDSATWVVNSTAFNTLDQLKDTQGRYLLQPDVTAPSGYSLFGRPVVRVANNVWNAAISKGANMVLADVSQAVAIFRRAQVSFDWEKFDNYASGLAIVTRDDYKLIDENAGFAITFNAAAA